MGRKVYVGNLTEGVTDGDLRQLFEPHGAVTAAAVMMNGDTGLSRGFGLVEMASDAQAHAAIVALRGRNLNGRDLNVREQPAASARVAVFAWSPAPCVTAEDHLTQIRLLGQKLQEHLRSVEAVATLPGTSAEGREKAVAAFHARLVVLERALAKTLDEVRLG
jgi:RNA recognition motif-containing protein